MTIADASSCCGQRSAWASVGAAFTATPFIESWLPSERARALGGPTQVDLTKIEAGQMIITIWRRQPMYVVHRTPAMMALLGNHDDRLKDAASEDSDQPAYCQESDPCAQRRVSGAAGHLHAPWAACPSSTSMPADPQLGATWPGGWLCPCHGSRFDLAGRVFDGSPASVNLVIPPYSYPSARATGHRRGWHRRRRGLAPPGPTARRSARH